MLFAISVEHEKYSTFFYFVFLLDFGAHWYQYQFASMIKSKRHRDLACEKSEILRAYYEPPFFLVVAGGYEAFLMILYLVGRQESLWDNAYLKIGAGCFGLSFVFKQIVNVFMLWVSIQGLLELDYKIQAKERKGKWLY